MPAENLIAGINNRYKENLSARCAPAQPVDFSWLLFVGTKMLGFTEREVGHFTLRKWSFLYTHFRIYHNFCVSQQLFKEEKTTIAHSNNDEWLPN